MRMDSVIDTCMYRTGLDPFTGEGVYTAGHLRDRKLQRALDRLSEPDNDFKAREALRKAGHRDLIGSARDALLPDNPPRLARQARMANANRSLDEGNHLHEIGNADKASEPWSAAKSAGDRPHRRTARRRPK